MSCRGTPGSTLGCRVPTVPPERCPYLCAEPPRCPGDPWPCRRGTLSTLPPCPPAPRVPWDPLAMGQHPPPSPPPASPQAQVPVEGLGGCRGVQGVTPLAQRHGAVGPAAPGRCQRQRGVGCWGHPHPLLRGTPTPLQALPAQAGCRQQVQRPARKVPGWQVGSMASLVLLARRSAQSHCHSSWALCGTGTVGSTPQGTHRHPAPGTTGGEEEEGGGNG